MKNSKKIITTLILSIPAIFIFLYKKDDYSEANLTPINCNANFSLYDGDTVMIAALGYDLYDGKGMITLNGTIYENGNKKTSLSIKKYVSYTKKNSYLKLQSEEGDTYIDPLTDTTELKKHIPEFYYSEKTSKRILKVIPLDHKKHAWAFSTSALPYFLCVSVK